MISTVPVIDQVDEDALRGLIRWHVDSGTDGLVALGTTGEAAVMSTAERQLVLNIAAEETRGKMPLIAGTSSIKPQVVVDQTIQVNAPCVRPTTPSLVLPYTVFYLHGHTSYMYCIQTMPNYDELVLRSTSISRPQYNPSDFLTDMAIRERGVCTI